MNADAVLADFRHEGRTLVWPGETLDALPLTTRRSSASGSLNMVTAFALDERNAAEAIANEIAAFTGRCFEWKAFSFDRPADLVERLRAAGFEVGEREALVLYDLADGLGPFEGSVGVEVRRVETAEDLRDYRSTAEAAFVKDHTFTVAQLAEALRAGDPTHEGYVAYLDGIPASVGRLYTHPLSLFAGLYGGGTSPAYRGKGLYRAVVAARALAAVSRGIRYLQVDALPTSLPILLRLGFVHLADTWPCASPQPGDSTLAVDAIVIPCSPFSPFP